MMAPFFYRERLTERGVQVMRDYKTIGIRLTKDETIVIDN
jgi:hypothetical protein